MVKASKDRNIHKLKFQKNDISLNLYSYILHMLS